MTLFMIGIGLNDEKDITVKGLEAVKKCDYVYLESYTSKMQVPLEKLEKFYGKKIIEADREMVESKAEQILEHAKEKNVAFLVIGDVFSATTHLDMWMRAKKAGIPMYTVHNASVLTAVGDIGLELYKYGKTTSIPYPEPSFKPETPYDVLKLNKKVGLHTLILLDLRPKEGKFMSVNEAIQLLLGIEEKRKEHVFTHKTLCIGCARLDSDDEFIRAGSAEDIAKVDFGGSPHCLVVPGKLHFIEEDMLGFWKDL
jgi:diphthine synthase